MKSAMKRVAGGVALTMVLIRGFCGGGVFLGYLGVEGLLLTLTLANPNPNPNPNPSLRLSSKSQASLGGDLDPCC